MRIQQIRNGTLKIQYDGVIFLLDPWLQDKGTGFSAATVKPEMEGVKSPMNDLPMPVEDILNGVDYALVTHVHPDHFTKDYLPKDLKILAQNETDAETIEGLDFENVSAVPDEGVQIESVNIKKTPTIHGDNDQIAAKMGEGSGYLLTGEDHSLYVAGDTVFNDEIARILKENSPEVIVLNGGEATLPGGRLIMGLDDIESVRNLCPNSTIIVTHLDSVNHALISSEDVRKFVNEKGYENILVPGSGEWIEA